MEIRLCADNYGSYKLYDWVRGVLHLNGVSYFLFSILYDKSNQGEKDVLCKTKDLIAMISCTHHLNEELPLPNHTSYKSAEE